MPSTSTLSSALSTAQDIRAHPAPTINSEAIASIIQQAIDTRRLATQYHATSFQPMSLQAYLRQLAAAADVSLGIEVASHDPIERLRPWVAWAERIGMALDQLQLSLRTSLALFFAGERIVVPVRARGKQAIANSSAMSLWQRDTTTAEAITVLDRVEASYTPEQRDRLHTLLAALS